MTLPNVFAICILFLQNCLSLQTWRSPNDQDTAIGEHLFQKDLDEQATITENSLLNYSQRVQLSAAAPSETYENRWLAKQGLLGLRF